LEKRIKRIIEVLDFNKAEDIDRIDLKGKGYLVDIVLVATALNNKHTMALLSHLKDLKSEGEEFVATEEDGDWVVIDLGDIMIHIMTQTHRDLYNIEEFLVNLEVPESY
jgi:ribosome silencing factor RsfS/YbeB/iojap